MKAAIALLVIVGMLLLFTLFKQPRCPKCKSKDIGLFSFHGRKIFTCHECGHKDEEQKL